MVHRPSTDSSVHARIDSLTAKHDELARAQSQGTTALRDPAGNVLTMGTGNDSMLTSSANDVGVLFAPDGSVQVTSGDGSAFAPLAAGAVSAAGGVAATGNVSATGNLSGTTLNAGVTVLGQTQTGDLTAGTCYTGDIHGGNLYGNFLQAGTTVLGPTQTGDLTAGTCTTGDIHGLNIYSHGTLLTSDGRLKEQFRPTDPGLLDRLLTVPVLRWRWKSKWVWDEAQQGWQDRTPSHREHVFPIAQDMPTELVVERPDGTLIVDMLSTTGALLALVQRQAQQIARLESTVADLAARSA